MKNMPTHPGRNGSDTMMLHLIQRIKLSGLVWMILLSTLGWLTACSPEPPLATVTPAPTQTPQPTQTPRKTSTPRPTATPTLPPLGEMGNPLSVGFILPPGELAEIAAEDLAGLLGKETGYVTEALFYPDFETLSLAIMNGDVDLFWLKPLEYLYLNNEGAAEVIVMTNHLGVYAYGINFIAHINSGFTPYFNPETGENFGDFLDALQQFSGTRPCYVDPHSIPGYFVPAGLLTNASTPTLDPVFTYGYSAIIRALYIRGICDFGITYAQTGDPFTASDILLNLPDAQNQIAIIWQADNLIPNLNFSASPNLPEFMRFRLEEALLRVAESLDGLNLISTALGYDVEALRPVKDNFYDGFRSVILPLELDLQTIIYGTPQP